MEVNPPFLSWQAGCLHGLFKLLPMGVAGLEEVHMAAQGDKQETREELDSLLNLMARLDFNHFFSEPPQLSSLLGSPL